jgi:hypothetical protein
VVRHLVVVDEIAVDRRGAAGHLLGGQRDVHVAQQHRRGPQRQERAGPADPGEQVAAPLLARLVQLGDHLADAQHERAGESVRRSHERRPASRRAARQPGMAHRQQADHRVAAERVADADPAVAEQAAAVAEPRLDDRRVPGPVRHHQPAGVLLVPAEAGNLPGRAVQDAGLRRRSGGRQADVPAAQRVAAGPQPMAEGGQVTGLDRPAQHRLGDAVELHHQQARRGARTRPAQGQEGPAGLPRLAPADPAHQPPGLLDEGVVAAAVGHPVQDRGEHHGEDRRHHQGGQPADPVRRVEIQGDHHDRHLGHHPEQHGAPAAQRGDADQQQRAQHRAGDRDQQHQAQGVHDVGAGHAGHQPQREGQHDEGRQRAAQHRPEPVDDAPPAEQHAELGTPVTGGLRCGPVAHGHPETIAQPPFGVRRT